MNDFVERRFFPDMGSYPFVAGVFKEEILAENAVVTLRSLDFREDQIYHIPRANSRETYHILQNLKYLGVPEEEALYYTSELEAGRSIVLVRHEGRLGEVLNILFLHGTRKHRYLDRSSYIHTLASHTAASISNGWYDRQETSQAVSSGAAPMTEEETESVRRILRSAGLEHLL